MEFEQNLFATMKVIYPALSVRGMSKLLGKSPGYWSSISAQRMPVSNGSLVHLLDALECQKILSAAGDRKFGQISQVQDLIVSELSARFQHQTGLEQLGEFGYAKPEAKRQYDALPFIVSSY